VQFISTCRLSIRSFGKNHAAYTNMLTNFSKALILPVFSARKIKKSEQKSLPLDND